MGRKESTAINGDTRIGQLNSVRVAIRADDVKELSQSFSLSTFESYNLWSGFGLIDLIKSIAINWPCLISMPFWRDGIEITGGGTFLWSI